MARFRLDDAVEEGDGDVLVGFAYGYTGEAGQWWTDNALKVLDPEIARVGSGTVIMGRRSVSAQGM